MPGVLEDYSKEVETLVDLYKQLRERSPHHEYLSLVTFDPNGDFLVKSEFWRRFELENQPDENGLRRKINICSNANSKLRETLASLT
ncbi:MAG: hypothetical protein AABX91_01360 [Nanoarchaeota archaeon]